MQLLSAGLERYRAEIVSALTEIVQPAGILARNDVRCATRKDSRARPRSLAGDVPREIEVNEHGVTLPGGALGRTEDRRVPGPAREPRAASARSRAAARWTASATTDRSRSILRRRGARDRARHEQPRCARAGARERRAQRLRRTSISWSRTRSIPARAGEGGRAIRYDRARPAGLREDHAARWPPRSAATRRSTCAPCACSSAGGLLFTASCSFHPLEAGFLEMLESAAADSGRRIALREIRGQPLDHPEVLDDPRERLPQGRAGRSAGLTVIGRALSRDRSAAGPARSAPRLSATRDTSTERSRA